MAYGIQQTTVTAPPAEFCPAYIPPESDVPSSIPSSSPTRGDLCNCQPGTLTLTIDFDLTCEDRTILTGDPGIEEAQCLLSSRSDPMLTDPVPVSIESVQIFELDASFDIVKTTNITESFESGDTITYESFAVTDTNALLSGQVIRGFQVTLNGFNAAGDDLSISSVILYTNECDVYPVLMDGSTIGWISLVSCCINYISNGFDCYNFLIYFQKYVSVAATVYGHGTAK
jgi:hypothetical protein